MDARTLDPSQSHAAGSGVCSGTRERVVQQAHDGTQTDGMPSRCPTLQMIKSQRNGCWLRKWLGIGTRKRPFLQQGGIKNNNGGCGEEEQVIEGQDCRKFGCKVVMLDMVIAND